MRHGLTFVLVATLSFFATHSSSAEDPMQPPNAREATWVMAGKIGLAASAAIQNADPQAVNNVMRDANQIANFLEIELPELPQKKGTPASYGATVLHYLLNDLGPATRTIEGKHGQPAAALMEMGVKSYILTTMYDPKGDIGLSIADVIESRAKRAQLPREIDDALLTAIRSQASYEVVKKELLAMHQQVRAFLHSPPPSTTTVTATPETAINDQINNALNAAK